MPADSRPITGNLCGLEDGVLWRRVLELDPTAFGLLYDRHSRAVYNFAFRRTASWSAAEEILQATFSTVWRKAAGQTLPALERGSALPWLLGVASRETQSSWRADRRQARRDARAQLTAVVGDHAEGVAAQVDDERRMSVVRRAMARIPAHERLTIELVVWSGLSVAEAALVLGVAEGTVKSRVARGRSRLAALLTTSANEEETR